MSFLTLNGIVVPVATMEDSDGQGGGRGETDQGGMFHSVLGPPRTRWSLTTRLLARADALAFFGLLGGYGEVWAESNFGSKGTTLETSLSAAGTAKFGANRFDVTAAPSDFVDLTTVFTALEDGYTVQAWHRQGAAAYVHYGLKSDGVLYEAGVINALSSTPFSVDADGLMTLDVVDDYDDIVAWPFVIPDDWITQMDLTAAWGQIPRMTAAGDFWHETVTVEPVKSPTVRTVRTADGAAYAISADLLEVVA